MTGGVPGGAPDGVPGGEPETRPVRRLRGARAVVGMLDAPAGAYVHVPFCPWICPFCPYNKVRARDDLAARYFPALEAEVDAVTSAHRARFDAPVTSVYVGGGTPTAFPDALADLLDRLPTTGERAVEVLPNHATPSGLDRLAEAGFTAVSIGAQSFHDGVLRHLGRPHDAATARSAVRAAVGRFPLVDVDLIVDVALEAAGPDAVAPPGAFLADVEECFAAGADQVSTYPLMRFGYTPFGRARHARRREHAVLAQVEDLAGRMGYERRSVWTFNRLGSAAYTSITRRRFLGMGAGASSVTGRDFLVNHFGIAAYCSAVEAGRLPVARWLHLGRWAGAAYDAFWQAYAGGVSPRLLADSYGRDVAAVVRAGLEPVRWAGLVRAADGDLRLTRRGFDAYHDLERAVTYEFIEPLWAQMLREHAAEGADVTPSCLPGEGGVTPAGRPGFSGTGAAGVSGAGVGVDDVAARLARAGAAWVRPEGARAGRLWRLASRAMEREVPLSPAPGAGLLAEEGPTRLGPASFGRRSSRARLTRPEAPSRST